MITHFKKSFCYKFCIPFRIIDDLSIFENNESLRSQIFLFFDRNLIENSIFNISLNEVSLIPEFFLAFTAVTIITHCSLIAYNKKYNSVLLQFSVTSLCMLIVFLTLLLYLHEGSITLKHLSFEFFFLNDSLVFLSKIITMIASLFCMYLLQDYIIEYEINSTEYDLLMLYVVLGLTMFVTANDFGTIFLALELQSLSLYMLSKFKKNSIYSIKNGLKYFILGAFSVAYFLLGWGLFYGIFGLFVLLGFHFFFNIFFDVSSEVEKNVLEYKINNDNQSNNNELIENSLNRWNNLFIDITNDFDEIGILLSFNINLKIVLKLAEFLCFEGNNENIKEILDKSKHFFGYFKLWICCKIELFLLLDKHIDLVKESLTKIIPLLYELKKVSPTIITEELILDCSILINFVSEDVFNFVPYPDVDTPSIIRTNIIRKNDIINFKFSEITISYWKRKSLLKNLVNKYLKISIELGKVIPQINALPPTPENILLQEKFEASVMILHYLFQFLIDFFDIEAQRFLFYSLPNRLNDKTLKNRIKLVYTIMSSEIFFNDLKVLTKTL
uniref:NADH:quinone oxidoreductase/Mrp antiporter transmembrane domain-containing protein n=1 Tax=Eunotia naegelii TaxID=1458866 RepID=A0A2U9GJ15_9STRA|nr:hypothetical protein [Eunotia naegelii]AWQ64111.1 hypothetical protein [Eunotia naegelii]